MNRISLLRILTAFAFVIGISGQSEALREQEKVGRILQNVLYPHLAHITTLLEDINSDRHINISIVCRRSLVEFRDGLLSGYSRAFKIFDSFSKGKPGFYGSHRFVDFGNYDQCQENGGRYVLLRLHLPPTEVRESWDIGSPNISWIDDMQSSVKTMLHFTQPLMGACLPSECSSQDVRQVVSSKKIQTLVYPITMAVESTESVGDFLENGEYLRIRLLCAFAICLLIVATFLGTWIPSFFPENRFLRHFDAKNNTISLFTPPSNTRLDIFNGWKVIYLILAAFAHLILPMNTAILPFLPEIYQFGLGVTAMKSFENFGVIVYFNLVVMGSLSVTSRWSVMKKAASLSVNRRVTMTDLKTYGNMTLMRILRTRPVMIVAVMIGIASVPNSSGLGPRMDVIQRNITYNCIHNGWKEILYFGFEDQPYGHICSPPAWITVTELYLYIGSFLILILLSRAKTRKLAAGLMTLLIILGAIKTGYVISFENISPSIVMWSGNDMARFGVGFTNRLYAQWYVSMPPYVIGLALGYFISTGYELPEKWRRLSWIGFSLSFVTFVSLPSLLFNENLEFFGPRTLEVLVGATHRLFCSVSFAGLMYLFWLERDSLVTKLLSHPIWTPLSRLSFSIFMTHLYVIAFIYGSQREVFSLSPIGFVERVTFMFLFSLVFGYLMYICVEAPFNGIVKELLEGRSKIPHVNASKNGVKSLQNGHRVGKEE